MELHTLSSKFLPKDRISEFTSAIWTERYSSAGDVQLVVKPIPSMIDLLAKGTFLGLRGTKEVMRIETHSIENGLLTVTGSSLPKFLNQRPAWFVNPAYDGTDTTVKLSGEYAEESTTAGQLIATVVSKLVISPVAFSGHWTNINLDWSNEVIQGLQHSWIDANGTPKRLSIGIGQLYDGIQSLAQEEGLGFKLYLESASYSGAYALRFATYRGKDRTSEQASNQLMRLSPKLDSLTDVKEINSIAEYKNVFYVSYKNVVSTHYIPGLPIPTGFDRRVILVEAPDIFFDSALPGYDAKVAAFREQVARNTIAEHVYIQSVDGQISQHTGYVFGKDYYLGDIIELEGFTGFFSKARVTEYIRSQDQFGDKEYPTLEVLDPLFIGYMPDLEPNSDFDPGFDEDPDFDFDFDSDDAGEDPETSPPDKDPRDPPDRNPDPEHEFPEDGPGDGEYEEEYVGGILELHPANDHVYYTDNVEDSGLGWYQHHDRIYLEGGIHYGLYGDDVGDPGGMITIAGGLPVEARPAEDTEITIYPDMPDSDSLYGHFTTFSGMVSAGGTITISPAPLPSYPSRIDLYLLFGNISWPVNPPIEPPLPPDTVDQESLEPWLHQYFSFPPSDSPTATTENAVIGAHGISTHLNGEVTLIEPMAGNLLQKLPEKYRASHIQSLAIPGSPGWYPAYVNAKHSTGTSLTFKRQVSKPLLRAQTLSDWLLGEPWVYEGGSPLAAWVGPAPEAPIRLSGRWSPPLSNAVETEFGFSISFTLEAPLGGQITYKVGAMKMGPEHNNEWWMMLEFFREIVAGSPTIVDYGQIPMGRLDSNGPYQGQLPNGVNMNVSIQPFGVPDGVQHIQIATNIGGTNYMFELPQQPNDTGPVWPSQIGASNGWGAYYTDLGGVPVSILTNIKGDYFYTPPTDPNGEFYPPTWLPEFGQVQAGYQFDLDGVSWRLG